MRRILPFLLAAMLGTLTVSASPAIAARTVRDYRNMPLPCNTVTKATTYDLFQGNYHGKALDFPVARSTKVLTPVAGTVRVYQGENNRAGNYVEVTDHTTGLVHRLLHLQGPDPNSGDYVPHGHGLRVDLHGKYVPRGTVVGRVGHSGLGTGDHLHYAVKSAGGNDVTIEMGGSALTWNRQTGDRETTFDLRSKNCRSGAGRWVLTDSLQPHIDTGDRVRFSFGTANYIPVVGDWDGDGVDTPGVFRPSNGQWVLTNSLQPHIDRHDRIRFKFGSKAYIPVVGDWDGDGIDTPGVFKRTTGNWVLTNSLAPDVDTKDRVRFKFGGSSYLPVAGNWDGYLGDKRDSVGVYNPLNGRWVLSNALRPDAAGADRVRFKFGGRNWLPTAGDWDGRPGDNPGVFDPTKGRWVLTNSLAPDVDRKNRVRFKYGSAVWTGVAGNWDGHGGDNAGVFAH